MQIAGVLWILVGVVFGGITTWLLAKARIGELRRTAEEANKREQIVAEELKTTLEAKGRYQSEAARVDEIKKVLVERDVQITRLNEQIQRLDREKTEALKDAEAADRRATDMVAKEREAQASILTAKEEQISKLNAFIEQARTILTTEFKALSAEALRDASESLARTAGGIIDNYGKLTAADVNLHKQGIEDMLKPVEATINRLDKRVEESDLARAKAEALLDEQVRRLAGASESLTNALRKPVIRGSWGEMTLENALENAGLQAEIDFVLQHTTDAEDGRKRTDAIINLPKGRKLVIDSKNLMESYLALANAPDGPQKAELAEKHSRTLSNHIKSLSRQEYWRRYQGLDCVFLFIPHDGMYHAAIKDEAELIRDACEKRVFIANPMSLIPLLKAIRYVLDQDQLNQSAIEIGKIGQDLYADLTRFAAHMAAIGKQLERTVEAYNDAIPALDRNIVAKSRKLKKLGSAKGADAELPEIISIDPRAFSSRELSSSNMFLQEQDSILDIAASSE